MSELADKLETMIVVLRELEEENEALRQERDSWKRIAREYETVLSERSLL